MLTLSSFPPEGSCTPGASSSSAYLLPSFRHVHDILLQPDRIETFIQAFVLPQKLHPAHGCLGVEEQNRLLRKPELQSLFYNNRDVDEVLILICGHGGRDERCGVMGPLLHKEFEGALINQGFQFASACKVSPIGIRSKRTARVGLISHIGGHKYAGNTIIYIPPSFVDQSGQVSPLAGRGVWYGRVEPKHVEGIVKETVLRGRVISELFRGAVGQGETTLNL
ncbi:MAG: hypothetical protein M1836_004383 [Candelina mexicana]|nr:MAG: hypothetical protein M1836_004383 [Candelina mexicana]